MQKLSPHLQLPSNNSEMLPDMEIHHTGVQDCDLQLSQASLEFQLQGIVDYI